MNGDDGFVDIGDMFIQVGNDFCEFKWYGIVYGIGNINGFCVGVYSGFYYVCQIVNRCLVSIFVGEFYVISVIMCLFNYVYCVFDDFIQCVVQFGGDVYW